MEFNPEEMYNDLEGRIDALERELEKVDNQTSGLREMQNVLDDKISMLTETFSRLTDLVMDMITYENRRQESVDKMREMLEDIVND